MNLKGVFKSVWAIQVEEIRLPKIREAFTVEKEQYLERQVLSIVEDGNNVCQGIETGKKYEQIVWWDLTPGPLG